MSFDVGADAYGRFMGRFSEPLAADFARLVGVRRGQRALDVGCGPGVLTAVLADRLGPAAVAAIDPSESFVVAARERLPGVDVRHGIAEDLPFADASFDLALAQLVVHFMTDPVAGLQEMARVTRAAGAVAASVWDHAGGRGPISPFWRGVAQVDPDAGDESIGAGSREGQLAELFDRAGLRELETTTLSVSREYAGFSDWWDSFDLGVGPPGAYLARSDDDRRAAVRAACADLLPAGPFTVDATAWVVVGTV